ncbi:SymE family type I addiction module toxin [uncultured Chryseobacterium sp.]|jgi:HSP20-like domain of unknown function (DUF1813).|uniref:SymE family type I addiction module toxin n=1 Tax=uncultured Chryseobacterium sp. TaxID=259322 RepID=UPI00263172E7|nr:SymE family type I addiction module toxin [uncultured Chryseobacterium sp.]
MEYKNRFGKVHYKFVPREAHYKAVPWLNLSGVWLEKLGFEIGDNIKIEIKKSSLVISVVQKAPKPDHYR